MISTDDLTKERLQKTCRQFDQKIQKEKTLKKGTVT